MKVTRLAVVKDYVAFDANCQGSKAELSLVILDGFCGLGLYCGSVVRLHFMQLNSQHTI